MKLSLVVPCYNEQEVIRMTHERLDALDLGDYRKEILYIDDGTAILDRIECGTFYGGYSSGVAKITVKDGTAASIKVSKNATVVIQGGNYTGSIKVTTGGSGSLTITGGTFAADPSAYVPETYQAIQNADGTWTVIAK